MRFVEQLLRARVVAILRRVDIAERVDELADRLFAAGVKAVEITLDQPSALVALRRLSRRAPDDALIGAGTVLTSEHVDDAVDAGARFLVSPHLDVPLIARAHHQDVSILPGVLTPTEIHQALSCGCQAVKLFPAGPLGTPYLKALLGPFPEVAFVPTGGITAATAASWFESGATAIGIGSSLFAEDVVNEDVRQLLSTSP